jgi:hypothetical protein
MSALPEKRLLVRVGAALVTLDLSQVREVRGVATSGALLLAQVLELPLAGPGRVGLVLETGKSAVLVHVEGVGGVVDVASVNVLRPSRNVLFSQPGLVRALMRVPEPQAWRGASLLPAHAADVVMLPLTDRRVLAPDLDPEVLGRLLLAEQESMGGAA